ncbi:conserved hypothetical protein [Nitrosococcus halophilus Nc 4]|uniref:Uncharacterized protein n=2 Tax=Nitrosococcus halophilus TaxID=133539 RepID=D5BYB2_NITHN|nr:conserved hypothetical protein [Nitrosococcus halophilus Nc 4]
MRNEGIYEMRENFRLTGFGFHFEMKSKPHPNSAEADSSGPFLLSTPRLLDDKNPLVETRENKIKQWTRKLPVMNLLHSSRALLDALTLLNEQPLQEKHRVQLLDIYRDPINTMLLSFNPLYLRQLPVPSTQREQVAQNITQLPLMLANGYKTVVKQGYQLGHKPSKNKTLLLAAIRACEQLSHALLHLFRIAHPVPPQLYLELNQLYRYAEHYQILHQVPPAAKRAGIDKDIATIYKQLMLLAIADPSRLSESEILSTYELLERLLTHVDISPPHSPLEEKHYFVVDLHSDHPPRALAPHGFTSENKNLRLFNTYSLLRKVGELLQQAENPSVTRVHKPDVQLLRQLAPYLNASYQRPSPDTPLPNEEFIRN